jgi:hypothetical protein
MFARAANDDPILGHARSVRDSGQTEQTFSRIRPGPRSS